MNSAQNINVGLLATEPELSSWFCEDIGCESAEDGQLCNFSNRQLLFQIANSEVDGEGLVLDSSKFDVYLGILRFVDVLSLQKMDQLLSECAAGKLPPLLILIYRNENESDFKMSCPYCGQKLWVRDADQDKRGRCPHCGKGFTLPDQEEHIRSTLRLPPAVQVRKVVRQDPGSLASPMRDIIQLASVENPLRNLGIDQHMAINDTMRVNIVDETAE